MVAYAVRIGDDTVFVEYHFQRRRAVFRGEIVRSKDRSRVGKAYVKGYVFHGQVRVGNSLRTSLVKEIAVGEVTVVRFIVEV